MSILFALFIGIAVNLDNLLIGINLGIRGQKLPFLSNFTIAAVTGFCSLASTYGARLISGGLLRISNITGAFIMILFGCYCLIKSGSSQEDPKIGSHMTFRETFFLGMVLAVNCIPPSFSAGVMELSPFYMGFFSALLSFLSMYTSNRLGRRMAGFPFLQHLTLLSALLLILIGCGELFF